LKIWMMWLCCSNRMVAIIFGLKTHNSVNLILRNQLPKESSPRGGNGYLCQNRW
jgi:hypothetical protein